MPKAVITFNLPEEREEYKLANRAGEYYSALWSFDEYLRKQLRYNEELTKKERETFESVREEFSNIIGNLLDD